MPAATRTENVAAHDGGSFDAHTVVPNTGAGPGLLLLQEIFGVNHYVRGAARRLADLGYVVLAPDLYWRIEPNVELAEDEPGVSKGIALGQRFDVDNGLADCARALDHLRGLPEVRSGTGVIGFCFGGTLAYHVAARFDPDAAVSYYGSGVPDSLDEADKIECPILLHFGGADPYIPRERVEEVRERLRGRDDIEVYVHEGAGHAFDNPAAMFHHADAAAAAWRITTDFLRRTLPP